MTKLGIVCAALAVAALAGSSQAFLVTNVTNNEVVFHSSSENGTPGENLQIDTPEIGTWDFIGQRPGDPTTIYVPWDTQEFSLVYDAATSPDGIAAYYGNNAQRITGGGPARPVVSAVFEGTPSAAGDVMKIECAYNAVFGWTGIKLAQDIPSAYTESPPWPVTMGIMWVTATMEASWGGGWDIPGCVHIGGDIWEDAHTPGQWSEIVMEYVNGSTSVDVTIDGASRTFAVTAGILNNVQFAAPYGAGIAYLDAVGGGALLADFNDDGVIDDLDLTALATEWPGAGLDVSAVPEPATLSLLVLGGLAALRRRRH